MKTSLKTSFKALVLGLLLLATSCTLFTKADSPDLQDNSGNQEYWLGDASPNPMPLGGSTTFEYHAKYVGEEASIVITNILDQEVITLTVNSDSNSLIWNGTDRHGKPCGSGVYFFRLSSPTLSSLNKLLLIK